MTLQLSSLIHQIRAAQSIDEERHVISTELANIRTYIRECDPEMRPRVIAKLVYLNMIGETTSWGQMETLNLMADERFSFKRIGYLGAGLLLDETADITVLLTHTIQKDLQSKHRFVVALALALLANIGSTELCRSLAADVQKVLAIDDPFLRKRAAMAVIRIVKKLPEFTETFQPHVHLLLNDPSHSVVLSGIGMVVEMLKAQPELASTWAKFTPAFVKILRSLIASSRSSDEASDPFLQVKVLEILALLRCPSDDLDEVLASIVSTVDMKRSDGRAVLLQAVQTIVAVGKKPSLRTLALTYIGRLLSFRESNVLYSALNVFSRVLYANRDIIDRSSSDSLALQRYKSQIVRCLDNPDISIRRRALDVISALIDKDNVVKLVPEILKYLHLADTDFRMELVGRIFAAIQRFSPNEQWTFDAIMQILRESGGYVKSDIISAVCKVVGRSETMQQYAVNKLEAELTQSSTVQPLVQVAAWILGEYGTETQTLSEAFHQILLLPQTTKETKSYIITALAKLASRETSPDQVTLQALQQGTTDNDLDLQQRSGEYLQLLAKFPAVSDQVLAPAPPVEEDDDEAHHKAAAGSESGAATGGIIDWNPTVSAPAQQKDTPLIDFSPVSSTPAKEVAPVQAPVQKPKIVPPPGAVQVFNSAGIQIFIEVKKTPGNKNMLALRTSVFNTTGMNITHFKLEYAVPQCWLPKYDPPSGDELQAQSARPIQQVSYWLNKGADPFALTIRVSYIYGTMPVTEDANIPDIFN